jgi:hypothetical protein
MNSSDGISHESEGGQPIDELATFKNVINNQINLKKLEKNKIRGSTRTRICSAYSGRPSVVLRIYGEQKVSLPLFLFLIF